MRLSSKQLPPDILQYLSTATPPTNWDLQTNTTDQQILQHCPSPSLIVLRLPQATALILASVISLSVTAWIDAHALPPLDIRPLPVDLGKLVTRDSIVN